MARMTETEVGRLKKTHLRYFDVMRATYAELLEEMSRWVRERRPRYVCFCDGNGLPRAWKGDLALRAAYAGADAVCADGVATEKMAAIAGGPLPERVIGPKLFPMALEYGVKLGWRHYFYGTNEATLEKLKAQVEARWPGVKVVGTYAPDYEEDPKLPKEMPECDFFWVGLGCPKQEKWCAAHKDELGGACLMAVGAVFDFVAGTTPDTPEWVHRAGLCWLWRLFTGGPRVFRRNVSCVWASVCILAWEWVRKRFQNKE